MNSSILIDGIFEYRLVDKREGGMGKVLILERISTAQEIDFIHQKKLAAKTFKTNFLDDKSQKLFEREISIWLNFADSIFQNDFIVKLLRTTRIKNKLYVLMPYYEKSLADIIRMQNINVDEALLAISNIVHALKTVFNKYGVVHQDLKPDNILFKKGFNKRNEYHVSDWGIANIQLNACPEIPTEKWVPPSFIEIMSNYGTLPYMSPERLLGFPSSISSDVYAVGLILFELLVGHLPFERDSMKPIEEQIIHGEYLEQAIWILEKNNHSKKLIKFIQNCIHPDPLSRYPNYNILSKDLKKLNRKWNFF